MQVILRVRAEFGVEIALREIFEARTVANLAVAVEKALREREEQKSMPYHSDIPGNEISAIDFIRQETYLDPGIRRKTEFGGFTTDPQNVFLTGATGFVGAFLLRELLDKTRANIHCLVRAADPEEGLKRLNRVLITYGLWEDSHQDRIIPIAGDLAKPLLGMEAGQFNELAGKIDTIYHNGALVNMIYPYSELKAANVLGTQEALRLACEKRLKPLHYISTLSVFNGISGDQIAEENEPSVSPDLDDGYSLSKWVAERLVTIARGRGIPASIYRPGRITGHSQSGSYSTSDLFSKMIKGCIELGGAPDLDLTIDMTPVDYVCKAIVYLSKQETSLNKNFHLVSEEGLEWKTVVSCIRSAGYHLDELTYHEWLDRLKQSIDILSDHMLAPLLPGFREEDTQIENHQDEEDVIQEEEEEMTERGGNMGTIVQLALAGIYCPSVNRGLIDKYLSYFVEVGFLGAPQHEARNLDSDFKPR
jgi:thioester reductase-like protein